MKKVARALYVDDARDTLYEASTLIALTPDPEIEYLITLEIYGFYTQIFITIPKIEFACLLKHKIASLGFLEKTVDMALTETQLEIIWCGSDISPIKHLKIDEQNLLSALQSLHVQGGGCIKNTSTLTMGKGIYKGNDDLIISDDGIEMKIDYDFAVISDCKFKITDLCKRMISCEDSVVDFMWQLGSVRISLVTQWEKFQRAVSHVH